MFVEFSDPPPLAVFSTMECASYAFSTLGSSKQASGFKVVDSTCTLGRTPHYRDEILARPAITGGDGVYAYLNKPSSIKGSCNNVDTTYLFPVTLLFRG